MGYKYVYFKDEHDDTKRELMEIGLNEKLGRVHGKILDMLRGKSEYNFNEFQCIRVEVEDFVNDNIPVNFRIGGINVAPFDTTLREALEKNNYKFYHEYNIHFNVENKKENVDGVEDMVATAIAERYQQWLIKSDLKNCLDNVETHSETESESESVSANENEMPGVGTDIRTGENQGSGSDNYSVDGARPSSWFRNAYLWLGRMMGIQDLDARRGSDGTPHRPLHEIIDLRLNRTAIESIYSELRTTDGRIFSDTVDRQIISPFDSQFRTYGTLIQTFFRLIDIPEIRNTNWTDIIATVHEAFSQNFSSRANNDGSRTGPSRQDGSRSGTAPVTNFFDVINSNLEPVNQGSSRNGRPPFQPNLYPNTVGPNGANFFNPIRTNINGNDFEMIVQRLFGNIDTEDVRIVLSQNEIDKLPVVTYSSKTPPEELTDNTCVICQDDFKDGDELTKLPCGHYFCKKCIFKMLKEYSNKCPTCRVEVVPGIPFEQNEASSINRPMTGTVRSIGQFSWGGSGMPTQTTGPIDLTTDQVSNVFGQMMSGTFNGNTIQNLVDSERTETGTGNETNT